MTRDATLRQTEVLETARAMVRSFPAEPNTSAVIARALERACRAGLADAGLPVTSGVAPQPDGEGCHAAIRMVVAF